MAGIHNSPICNIIVGITPFKVHEAVLKKTTFFEVHHAQGLCKPQIKIEEVVELDSEDSGLFVQPERPSLTVSPEPDTAGSVYHLTGKYFYNKEAFDKFITYVYGATVSTPQDYAALRKLFLVYGLARFYKPKKLEERILFAIKKYYQGNTVRAADVLWLAKTSGELDMPLIDYLFRQMSYELADNTQEYLGANSAITNLLSDENGENSKVRTKFFDNMLQYLSTKGFKDPAKG